MVSQSSPRLGKSIALASSVALSLLAGCGDGSSLLGKKGSSEPGEGSALAAHEVETEIDGVPADGAVTTDAVELNFKLTSDELDGLSLIGYECKLNGAPDFSECKGSPFVISGLRDGEEYSLIVRAVLRVEADGDIVFGKESTHVFKVDLSAGNVGPLSGNPVRALADTLQVGSAFQVKVPVGLHVTEYSTSKTTGVLSVFRILPESDPYYLGNFDCGRDWDRVIASIAPAGQPLMYCHSTPTRAAYKKENESRLANNHVELATDTALVSKDSHERLSISIFDADFEFTSARSRFYNACQNSRVRYIDVPMLNNFFLGKNPEEVRFWYCDTYQPDMNGEPQLWRVGSFHDVDNMDWGCSRCSYPRAVEAVYMARANADIFTPELFARTSQARLLDVMTKITP